MSDFASRLRARDALVGYWVALDNPVGTERIARLGYDHVCLDMQHGLIGYVGMVASITAIDAGGRAVAVVRVGANDPAAIGRALDAGAAGVIVPLVNTVEDAAAAVAACRYPPIGLRSYGPMRSALRFGPDPRDSDVGVACIAMIETGTALEHVEAICAVPGLDGVYIGPSDLAIGIGAVRPGAVEGLPFEEAIARIRTAAATAGIASGFHCVDGEAAKSRLEEGFSFVNISGDLIHLEQAASCHLSAARPG